KVNTPNSPRLQRGLLRKAILSLFENNHLFFIFIKNNFPTWKRNMPPSSAMPRRPTSTQRSSTIRAAATPTLPSGSTARKTIGLARSLAVMTGDTISAEVYAKYLDPDPSNWTAALHDLMAAIAGGTAPTGTVIEAVPPFGSDGFPFAGLLDAAKAGETGTRAYLNILLFDENLGFLDAAFVPVSMAAKEDGTNVPHEKLSG